MSTTVAAAAAIKKLRIGAKVGLLNHISKIGPLPTASTPALPSGSNVTALPNPFLPHKSTSGKWRPPVYSLRKQADLVKAAKANGLLHLLPPGPKSPASLPVSPATEKALQVAATKNREAVRQTKEADRVEEESAAKLEASTKAEQEIIQAAVTEARAKAKHAQEDKIRADTVAMKAQQAEQNAAVDKIKSQLRTQGDQKLEWLEPIAWVGKVKNKAKGAELGVTLYAGRKRMFKGHKWERVQQEKKRKQAILLRDMKKRIFNYKNYYKRRRPDPLKPPRTLKAPKLPF